MMLLVILFSIIITGKLHFVRTELRVFPRHIIGTDRNTCISAVIILLHEVTQPYRNLSSVCIHMGIINFISNTEHDNTWMIPVTHHPAFHITFAPFLEKPCIIISGFRPFPHIKGFRNHQDSHLICQLHYGGRCHVVRTTQCIHSHFF